VRDGHRLREKIELTMDDRQVAALAVGALLLLAGMFALGLLVGMQLARRSPQPALAGDLAALDEQRVHAQRIAAPPRSSEQAARPEAKKDVPPPPSTVNVAPARTVAVKPEPPNMPEPPGEPGNFTVQLGASQDSTDAAHLAARAGAAGLKAYVAEARLPGKGIWYRVRVGTFADKDAAERFRRDVERELRTSAVVMPAR
jgi:DedD protein